MLFRLTLLRERGKRLVSPEPVHTDAQISSEQKGNFLQLSVASYMGGPSHKVAPLFEARLMKMSPHEILFLGFEQVEGRAYVQEWLLTASSIRTDWATAEYAESTAQTM
jgi:hypothetical protein